MRKVITAHDNGKERTIGEINVNFVHKVYVGITNTTLLSKIKKVPSSKLLNIDF